MNRASTFGGTGFSLSSFIRWTRRATRSTWRGLREWCGDAAYERYLRSARKRSGTHDPLSPAEFYVEQLNRRYSRPNRCC
jgi:uncharacterized short protein YbdD (DUF466 family)